MVSIKAHLESQACDSEICFLPAGVPVEWQLQVLPLDRQRAPEDIRHKQRLLLQSVLSCNHVEQLEPGGPRTDAAQFSTTLYASYTMSYIFVLVTEGRRSAAQLDLPQPRLIEPLAQF